jgi:hypothetical protein
MAWFFKYGEHEGHPSYAMADGSVRFLSDPSGYSLGAPFQINLATDQPTESKTLGEPVTFTATISNPPGFAGGVFVASADLEGSVPDGASNTVVLGEGLVDTRWVPIVGDWNGDGRDAVGNDNSYAGSHLLYQDFVVPVSNLDPYVLTSVDHVVGGGRSILEFSVENHPNNPGQSPGEYQECKVTKLADAPEINDEVLVFSHEEGANDSIWIDIGAPTTGTGYGNPSPFQINSAGADDMGRSFDLVFATQTAVPQREGNAVATESLEIAHEGFLGDRDDGWCMGAEIDSPESVHALYDLFV